MSYQLFEEVVLLEDIPEKSLRPRDVATIVEYHPRVEDEDGYTLEVFNALRDMLTIITVAASAIEPR
jgi:hypothetical protein